MTTNRETADHAERAIVAWAERGPESRELCDVQLFDALTDEEREAGWISEPLVTAAYAETLLSEIAALRGLLDERDLEIAEDDAAMRDLDAQIEDANDRATQAERQRDELLEWKREAMGILEEADSRLGGQGDTLEIITSDFLSRTRTANQGADQ